MKPDTHLRVDFLDEEAILVGGTLDPMEALRRYVAALDGEHSYLLWGVSREFAVDTDAVASMAAHLYRMLAIARPGRFRKRPCLPHSYGADMGWKWEWAFGSGRGSFEGVLFDEG